MPIAEVNGTTLAYVREGSGEPVLLIQGTGCVGEGWRPQIDALSGAFECVAHDNRGIGGSAPLGRDTSVDELATDAAALLDHLGWQAAHVVGHSMGGLIAQRLALTAPGRVRSLTLMCTFARGRDAVGLRPFVVWMGIRTRLGTRRMRRHAFLEMVMSPAALAGRDRDALAEEVRFVFGRDLAEQPPIVMKQVAAMRGHDDSARLGELAAIPTLVLSAEHDRIAPPAYGRALAEAIEGARYVEVDGAAHGVTITEADRVNAILREHLAGADAPHA